MGVSRRSKPPCVLTLLVTVATVDGSPPRFVFIGEYENDRTKGRHSRAISGNDEKTSGCGVTEVGKVMLKFRQLEADSNEAKKDDVYSSSFVPPKYAKYSKEYGTPKPGTKTEMRAQKASKHVAKEMLYLCEVIDENGYRSKDGRTKITFGRLFNIYQHISDKLVGMLLRCRKHHMVDFEGEMLFQRRDDDVIITLLLTPEEIKTAYANL